MTWRDRIEDATREGSRDQLLTSAEAGKLLRVTKETVERWGRSGVVPRVFLSSRAIRYKATDIRSLIRERTEG